MVSTFAGACTAHRVLSVTAAGDFTEIAPFMKTAAVGIATLARRLRPVFQTRRMP
ncbi:MAG: hypothetical protein HKL85_04495 [Acidimicrobiaceae bacterium]|nr:hypothetical protein [Acidimicrobiaceae bacterium]